MAKRNRIPEEDERRAKICELLQLGNIGSLEGIQNLFNGLEEELDDELGYSI